MLFANSSCQDRTSFKKTKHLYIFLRIMSTIHIEFGGNIISILRGSHVTMTWRVSMLRAADIQADLQIWSIAAKVRVFNQQLRTADKGCPPVWRLDEMLKTSDRKHGHVMKYYTGNRIRWVRYEKGEQKFSLKTWREETVTHTCYWYMGIDERTIIITLRSRRILNCV
jgi:hypothetical protein